jgi:hypothetical protein
MRIEVKYEVRDRTGALIADGENRQQPIAAAIRIAKSLPIVTTPPFEVLRVTKTIEYIGWVTGEEFSWAYEPS